MTAEEILEDLRANGWMVAVHNDYRLDGSLMTFWLFTHECGAFLKSEGETDLVALQTILRLRELRKLP